MLSRFLSYLPTCFLLHSFLAAMSSSRSDVVFTGSFKGVSRKFQKCFKEVSSVFQGSFRESSRVFQVRLKEFQVISREFQGYLKEV